MEEVRHLRPSAEEARRRLSEPPVLLVLPGSRTGEIERLLGVFAQTVELVGKANKTLVVIIPAVPHLVDAIAAATKSWTIRPRIVVDRVDKQAAFRVARAALAKSGTVTLELALAGVPMVAAYRVSGSRR